MKKPVEKDSTFSKSILSAVLSLYLMGGILGTVLVMAAAIVDNRMGQPLDSAMFMAYAAYLGGPTATAIGFYAWKSKAENILKIGKSLENGTINETVVNTFTTMGGN